MPIQSTFTIIDKAPNQPHNMVVGEKHFLLYSKVYERFGLEETTWNMMLSNNNGGLHGFVQTMWVQGQKLSIALLPEIINRHNSLSKSWNMHTLLEPIRNEQQASIIAIVPKEHQEAITIAIARVFPSFGMKSNSHTKKYFLEISDEPLLNYKYQILANAVRYAADLFDRPPNILGVSHFVQEAKDIANRTKASIRIWDRERLKQEGFGGIYGVGQASTNGPAFVVLHHKPENAQNAIAWVGKGIVYDTGGLSIKPKTSMPSMKGDMGGAAAVLAAFEAAILLDVPYELYAVLCLAENSVGPDAIRPDDVLVMLSGKTVEVNNTDAEGRLVLADGVFWSSKHTNCSTIIDIATLTGAAPISVGTHFAAIYCNNEELEQCAIRAGRKIGELAHPLPYTPEFYYAEFSSSIADMKNSVKNRSNAQSACAGQFIGNHLYGNPSWLHIDIAGPAWGISKRGVGFGVGLLLKTSEDWIEMSETNQTK